LARLAILLCEDKPATEQHHLIRILDFFGVPWKTVKPSMLMDLEGDARDQVVFGAVEIVAATHETARPSSHRVARYAAVYAYPGEDRCAGERGLRALSGNPDASLQPAPAEKLLLKVSGELADITGPMAGLEVSLRLNREDSVLAGAAGKESGFAAVISAGDGAVFARFQRNGVPFFFCTSPQVVDIEQTAGPGFYDVKGHFCSAVPLVMFLRRMFPEAMWQPQELGACLIVDDPLLRPRYGFCDFKILRNLMQQYGFTTNIAFIPWNWRRTSSSASEFFRNERQHFSVSIHGCDHTGGEFGATSAAVLDSRARLAQSRMRSHEARTGIHHDAIMVFPQGVFSSASPGVLKRNGFIAAVNTETVPTDSDGPGTRIRDVWDIAIMRYGCFPIFTRRYAHHGLENFAFDLLLGKPCLIVSHHEFFKDGCAEVIDLIEKLQSLNCRLDWRPLEEVIRRACRRRVNEAGVAEVEMYGSKLAMHNALNEAIDVHVRKVETETDLVSEVRCDDRPIAWTGRDEHLVFGQRIGPGSEKLFQVVYREQEGTDQTKRSLRFELSVAVRRRLSEFRDDHVSTNRLLSTAAGSVKSVLTKAN
jgi:hypothetical protein